MSEESIYKYWGKADPKYPGEPKWHPAILHMLDVAAVTQALLESAGPRRELLRHAVSAGGEYDVWLVLLAALHDIGKVTPGFQIKIPELAAPLKVLGLPFQNTAEGGDHKPNGLALLTELFRNLGGATAAYSLAQFPASHHGEYLSGDVKKRRAHCDTGLWDQARGEVVEALRGLFGVAWDGFPWRDADALPTVPLVLLAGLIAVADWIGSDHHLFPYCDPAGITLRSYWRERLGDARAILADLHLRCPPAIPGQSQFDELFPFSTPNPCQRTVLEVARAIAGPALLIVETPMGSGKTEAALAVADIALRERGASGLYYALPTQATANQMFRRLCDFLERNPGIDETELHLLHAYAALQPDYATLRAASIDEGAGDLTASDWFTGRKRGLLAPFAVGTVDQALMAALRSKHHGVRLFALAGKVVVIDEVHAFDIYTGGLIENLLRWLARLGCTVILLSATLPPAKRVALVRAWRTDAALPVPAHYPCVIGVGTTGEVRVRQVEGIGQQPYRFKPLQFPKQDRLAAVARIVARGIANGGCAVCILNTVGEAQALFRHFLRERLADPTLADVELILFHARFPLGQRLEIEKRLEALFGKPEKAGDRRPQRAVVVATQVLEQSLDVDFDLMASDLAPIDLLLQRAGRLHRHLRPRPAGLEEATLYILQPDLQTVPDLKPSEYVYGPELLLKTALLLESGEVKITSAEDLEALIRRVYEEPPQHCPPHLQAVLEDKELLAKWGGKALDQEAQKNRLPPCWDAEAFLEEMLKPQGLLDDDAAETEALSRLARKRVTLVVLHDRDGIPSLHPDRLEPVRLIGEERIPLDEARTLLLHSVSISDAAWVAYFEGLPLPPPWRRTALLRRCRMALFRDGELVREGRRLQISETLGLEIIGNKEKRGG